MRHFWPRRSLTLSSAAVYAGILTVTNNNDSGPGSLRAAVAVSASGDTVTFDAALKGKIVLTSGQIPITHALTITGPGWRQLQVEGNANDRIFEILDAAPAAVSRAHARLSTTPSRFPDWASATVPARMAKRAERSLRSTA